YSRDLAGLEALWLPPPLPDGHESSYYFHWVQFTGGIRDRVAAQLYAAGIYTTFRYEPPHRVPIFGAVEAAR
ncbi:MAG TPA: DegT/DnrJ/EryC1/StrS family aminotransferase, partial [Micromonosporaceae bacterium]